MKKFLLLFLLGGGTGWFFGSGEYQRFRAYYEPYRAYYKPFAQYLFSASEPNTSPKTLQEISARVDELQKQEEQLSQEVKTLKEQRDQRTKELTTVNDKLTAAQASLTRSEENAKQAEAKAKRMQCEADKASVAAEASRQSALCLQDLAMYSGCKAENEEDRAGNTLFFTLLGAGAAMATGGSSLLLTTGGAGLGYVSGGDGDCGEPPGCEVNRAELEAQIIREGDLSLPVDCNSPDGPTIQYEDDEKEDLEPRMFIVPDEEDEETDEE